LGYRRLRIALSRVMLHTPYEAYCVRFYLVYNPLSKIGIKKHPKSFPSL